MSDLKSSEDSDNNSEEEDDDEDVAAPPPEGMYDPSDYEYLNVSSEIKELFNYIVRYTPQTIEIETRFKPFIPEYIPAVGDIDAFLKVENRSVMDKNLGLKVLDEPSFSQSDPTIVELQQTALSKQIREKSATSVKKIKPDKNLEQNIDKWIEDIAELAAVKPVATVRYRKPVPEIQELLKVEET